jgi:hypothetical protein
VLAIKAPTSTTRERNLLDMVSLLKATENRWRFGQGWSIQIGRRPYTQNVSIASIYTETGRHAESFRGLLFHESDTSRLTGVIRSGYDERT